MTSQYLVYSTNDKWYTWAAASARGFRSDNLLTSDASTGLTQVDYSVGSNKWFQFQGSVLQSGIMPSNAVITRYRIYWRQHSSNDPCLYNQNIWSQWSSSWRFALGPDSITDPNDGFPGYNITYGFSTGNYFTGTVYGDRICTAYGCNCLIDSDVFDPSISRFLSGTPSKSLDNVAFWNDLSNLFASFAVPTDVRGLSISNFIGPPTSNCCYGSHPSTLPFIFLVDYSTSDVYYRKRYNISYSKQITDVTQPSTAPVTTTTSLTTTTVTTTTTQTSTISQVP